MLKPLTSLRFFFALMVFLDHLYIFGRSDSHILQWLYRSIFQEGYLGVSFFFILSGFILAYNYQKALLNGQKTKKEFYLARFARIYPLHVLCILISIPLLYKEIIQDPSSSILQSISNITLTQSFIPIESYYYSFNLVSWSISDEMFFYLMFPLIISVFYIFSPLKTSILFIFSKLLILILLFIIPQSYYSHLFYVNPLFRITDFLIGIALYNIYVLINNKGKSVSSIWEYLSILLFVVFFIFNPYIPKEFRYSVYYWIPMSAIILAFAFQKGWLSKILSNKYLVLLGEISFGFYMFHYMILKYLIFINKDILKFDSEIYIAPLALVITLIVSYLSFIWFEQPMNKYIKRRLGNR